MFKRFAIALTALAAVVTLVTPDAAFARQHFTTTNERLQALNQRATSAVALTAPAEIQTQLREIISQAQAAKAAGEEAAARPVSSAEDKSVMATVGTEMDAIVASANRAMNLTGADQKTALTDIQTRADRAMKAVQARIAAQQAAPAASPSPGVLPAAGSAADTTGTSPILWLLGGAAIVAGLGLTRLARRGQRA
ncbi:MAG: hypothetical protein U0821_19880 [Chloroflexota bacterium]